MTLEEMQAKVTEVMGREPTRVTKHENPLQPYKRWLLWYLTTTDVLEHVIVLFQPNEDEALADYALDGSILLDRAIAKLNSG